MPEYQVPREGDALEIEHKCWTLDPSEVEVVHVAQLPITKSKALADHRFAVMVVCCCGETHTDVLDAKSGTNVVGTPYTVVPASQEATR